MGYDETTLEVLFVVVVISGLAAILGGFLVMRGLGGVRHRLTRPALRKRALEESRSLSRFVEDREASRPERDPIIKDHEYSHRRVTLHDEETQGIYAKEHLPRVADIRAQLAGRHVKNQTLDDLYESVENNADIRTISTALAEMAERV
ncbi:MAG: hypothetical protein WA990_02510 [Rubrobacteraceae bacterium]